MPIDEIPRFLHSTSVVPVPQKGSSTVLTHINPKTVKVLTHEVRRKREYESIPRVGRTIVRHQFIPTSVPGFPDRSISRH